MVLQETKSSRMKTLIRCRKEDMLWINYESPDGEKRHQRLWNGGNGTGRIKLYRKEAGSWELIDDIRAGHVGCEYGEYA